MRFSRCNEPIWVKQKLHRLEQQILLSTSYQDKNDKTWPHNFFRLEIEWNSLNWKVCINKYYYIDCDLHSVFRIFSESTANFKEKIAWNKLKLNVSTVQKESAIIIKVSSKVVCFLYLRIFTHIPSHIHANGRPNAHCSLHEMNYNINQINWWVGSPLDLCQFHI